MKNTILLIVLIAFGLALFTLGEKIDRALAGMSHSKGELMMEE
jgi:hypothetical protein